VFGYLDGSIKCPITPSTAAPIPTAKATSATTTAPATATAYTTISTAPTETPWDSETPSLKEWKICDTWTLSLLMLNTKNSTGLEINIDDIAAEAWTSYINTYEKAYNMTWLNAEQILQNTLYTDRIDFTDFIINMRIKWSDTRALGSKINDKDFKDIIISSLPESWSSATAPLYDPDITSADAIACLQIWHTKSHKTRLTNTGQNTMVLHTSTFRQGQKPQLVCTNPNCHQCSHTIEMCYWPGESKKGQFFPGFGKRDGIRGSATST